MQIRCLDESWLDRVMELEAGGFPPEIQESREVFARRLACFPQGFLGGFDDAGKLLGYFYAEVWPKNRCHFDLEHDPADAIDLRGTALYIASMTIDPDLRGQGLGGELFESGCAFMHEIFPDLEEALLMVREDWIKAIRIYQSAGFALVEERSGLLGGYRALIMKKSLASV